MALRNAFDGLATDSLLRRILNAVNMPKDSAGRLQVSISSAPSWVDTTMGWANNDVYTTMYNIGSPMSMDAREQFKAQLRNNAKLSRQRWTIT